MKKPSLPLKPDEIAQLRAGKSLIFTSLFVSTSLEESRSIMGNHLIDLQSAADWFGFKVSRCVLEKYGLVPFSREELELVSRLGFYLLATPSMGLDQLFKIDQDLFGRLFGISPVPCLRPGYLLVGIYSDSDHQNLAEELVRIPNGSVANHAEAIYLRNFISPSTSTWFKADRPISLYRQLPTPLTLTL